MLHLSEQFRRVAVVLTAIALGWATFVASIVPVLPTSGVAGEDTSLVAMLEAAADPSASSRDRAHAIESPAVRSRSGVPGASATDESRSDADDVDDAEEADDVDDAEDADGFGDDED
jgi:hypothetical protein